MDCHNVIAQDGPCDCAGCRNIGQMEVQARCDRDEIRRLREENARLKAQISGRTLVPELVELQRENARLKATLEANIPSRVPGSLQEEVDFLRRDVAALQVNKHHLIDRIQALTRERDEARAEVAKHCDVLDERNRSLCEWQDTARNEMAGRAAAEAEVSRLEGLILVGYKWLDPERPSNLTWDEGGPHETDAFEAEARRIRAQREGCRVCATKAVGLPTPGYTHDESCAQREKGE